MLWSLFLKFDKMNCNFHTGVNRFGHFMMVVKSIFQFEIFKVKVNEMKFIFMSDKGSNWCWFILRRLQAVSW